MMKRFKTDLQNYKTLRLIFKRYLSKSRNLKREIKKWHLMF